ncbi:MAG: hypothetical protein QG644_556 [Patescibacteria group bacterium]|nr:hypothetical protein [Patescibacteria group bacterium]
MQNTIKRLVILGLTLVCFFFVHSEANAQLNISSDKSSLQIGQSATITATSGIGSGNVFFKQSPTSGGSFSPGVCTTTGGLMSTTCSVQFYPTATGTFIISGAITINGQTTQSQSATNPRITVTQNTSGTPTLSGVLVDSTPPSIYQGDQVELKITATPIPTGGPTVFISSPTLGNIGTCIINTTAGGICTSGFGPIRLNTGIEGTHDINFSTTSWPNYTGTVSGIVKMTVLKTITNPPVLDICIPPKIKTSTGTCIDPSTISNSYTYLAPLSEEKSFDPTQDNALSKYINLVVKIAIGIAAVLAVIMIVMGGIQYMTSELISSKEEGKKRITNAILGLLIALGAYLILFTINPNLLKLDVPIPVTSIGYDEEEDYQPILDNSRTAVPTSGIIANCPLGVTRTTTANGFSFISCKDIADKVKQMIEDAARANITLTGGGFRTAAEQIAVRKRNCGTTQYDIYEKPSRNCNPQTARPGRSVHESGKAFDLKCNGTIINWDRNPKNARFGYHPETKVCFDWLKANASRYGLYNLPSENWHWSVNGK